MAIKILKKKDDSYRWAHIKTYLNKFALLSLSLILFVGAKAQDRIISVNNDTIDCKIAAINNERIIYELKNNDGTVTGRSLILSQVAEYTRSSQLATQAKPTVFAKSKSSNVPEQQWSFGLNIGKSNMPSFFDNLETANRMPDGLKQLSKGWHINTSVHYMLNNLVGVGAEHSFFHQNSQAISPIYSSYSMFFVSSETYREYINFVGPSVLFQQHLGDKRKFSFTQKISAGGLFFRIENQSVYPNFIYSEYVDKINNMLITGDCFSAKLGLTASYRLSPKVSVGIGFDYLWASLKKVSMESKDSDGDSYSDSDQEMPEPINLSRFDYSLVLRYNL